MPNVHLIQLCTLPRLGGIFCPLHSSTEAEQAAAVQVAGPIAALVIRRGASAGDGWAGVVLQHHSLDGVQPGVDGTQLFRILSADSLYVTVCLDP